EGTKPLQLVIVGGMWAALAHPVLLLATFPWGVEIGHVPARTGGEWPRSRGLLPSDRARALVDLQYRRRRQPCARRVLRVWLLRRGCAHRACRLRPGVRDFADRGGAARVVVRALYFATLLHRRSDARPARDLRARHGRRAIAAHHLWCCAAVAGYAAESEG